MVTGRRRVPRMPQLARTPFQHVDSTSPMPAARPFPPAGADPTAPTMPADSPPPLLRITDLRYAWPGQPELLAIPRFELQPGEQLFLYGPSGSGKSTLLNLVAGTLVARHGRVELAGRDLAALPAGARDRWRADHVGIVFQQFNLLPFLPMIDNVLLPCRFSARRRERALGRDPGLVDAARRLLAQLGLDQPGLLQRPVGELSVGQQQRVAAARALIGAPELVVADEPTSALDADARDDFLRLLFAECGAAGAALLYVSHDHSLRPRFARSEDLLALNRVAAAA